MTPTALTTSTPLSTTLRRYVELCKPRIVLLIVLTAVVGMCLASPQLIPFTLLLPAIIGISCAACAAAVINQLYDRSIDQVMARTQMRPIVQHHVSTQHASLFAGLLCGTSILVLWLWVNTLTAFLTVGTLVGYAWVYTVFLKYATPQNIVIGGLAGAFPPLLGWTAVTNHISAAALLLVAIIFVWTPPHFWALAIHRRKDYARAKVPMLPNTHGIAYTKLHILLYTILLCVVSLMPFCIRLCGWPYLCITLLLNARFLYWAISLYRAPDHAPALATFRYSIIYLSFLFITLLGDHYLAMAIGLSP